MLGINHIADFQGYDHILFILTLCGIYVLRQWRLILVLITAFTLGHSVTLVLATFDIVTVSTRWIEFLIPVTILITALANMVQNRIDYPKGLLWFKYTTALFFGLIHGLGFSNYLKNLLITEEQITMPLFAFNIGIELGQIIIVFGILLMAEFFIHILKVYRREWNLIISGMGMGISLVLMLERWP